MQNLINTIGQKVDNVGIKMRQSCVKVSSDLRALQAKAVRYRFGAASVVLSLTNMLPHIADYMRKVLTAIDIPSSCLYVVLPGQNL